MIVSRILLGAVLLLASPAFGQPVYRELLAAPSDWYVDQLNGNDANDCKVATPCKTIQPTLNKLIAKYDFAGTPTVHLVASGGAQTYYREPVNLNRWVGSAANFRLIGDPSNNALVVVAPQNSHSIVSSHAAGSPWQIESLMVQSSPGYYGIISDAGSHITLLNMNFGGCGIAQMFAEFGGFIETLWDVATQGNYIISGGAQSHVQVSDGGIFVHQKNTITFQNTPTFTHGFVAANEWGLSNSRNLTAYSGARSVPAPKYTTDGTGEIVGPTADWP